MNKKTLYIMLLVVISLLGIVIVPTYAKFASSFTTGDDVVGMSLNFNIGISNLEEYEEVRVEANSYQVFNVEIMNTSGDTAYYGVWYQMVNPSEANSDILIARHADNEVTTSGSINNSGSITTTVIVKNNSNQNVKFNIGVASSTTSVDAIEYLGGKKLISGVLHEEDYSYDDTTSKYVSSSDNNIEFTTTSSDYSSTGSSQTFTPDHDGVYKLEAWGASGGDFQSYKGGLGGYTSGTIRLSKDDPIQIFVGGAGSNTINGGYNGGSDINEGQQTWGSSGGGATDFRLHAGTWDNDEGLRSRIMVAAGGGGGNDRNITVDTYKYGAGNGGYGGGLVGGNGESVDYQASGNMPSYNSHNIGTGGSQVAGGVLMKYDTAGNLLGTIATGGFGKTIVTEGIQSGGGGGYYAGGMGGHGGAGGGSSYISGYQGCVAITSASDVTPKSGCSDGTTDITCSYHYSGKVFKNTTMIAGNASMPTHDGSSTMIGNSGAGYAKVTPIVPNVDTSNLVVGLNKDIPLSDITCIDNGAGCKVMRTIPSNTNGLSKGTHNITVMVQDGHGVVYKYVKTFSVNNIRDINITSIKIDGVSTDSLPTSGLYTMTSNCSKGSVLNWNTYSKSIIYKSGAKVGDQCSLEFTTDNNRPKLSSMQVGSYVAYEGTGGTVGSTKVACQKNGSTSSSTADAETEAPNSCLGQNAREDLDTSGYTHGYCYGSSYKYVTTGWRIAYIDQTDASNPKAILVSAGSPECNNRVESTANVTYIQTANAKALKYCNQDYVDGDCTCIDSDADGLCDSPSTDAWAINDTDFYYMTKAISGYGKRLSSDSSSLGDSGGSLGTTLYCQYKYSYRECGYNNDLIDNGGYYWFASRYISSNASGMLWHPYTRSVYNYSNTNAYGLRPVIRLSSSVYVTGGSGTMEDPYTIGN